MSSGEAVRPVEGSYRAPSFENARVADAMRAGVLTCPPEATLRTVARTMATHHIHSVIVSGVDERGGELPWGIVSDLDLVRAGGQDLDLVTAGQAAASAALTVAPDETLERAAQLMAEHDTAHIVVADPQTNRPVGVLSSLDVAGILAWGRS